MYCLYASILLALTGAPADDRPTVVIVVGAPGTPEYASEFRGWADSWKSAAGKAGAETVEIGLGDAGGASDRDRLIATLAASGAASNEPLWLVLMGHGTFDGREAKFNLRGPDVTDLELAKWLDPIKRPVVVIDCTSASAPFLNRLSKPNRSIITATRSGSEVNYARFGHYMAEAIADINADLDKDGQVSLLEAYLSASRRGLLPHAIATGERARLARRQWRPAGYAARLVPGRQGDPSSEGRRPARRHPRPPVASDPQRSRTSYPRRDPPPPRRARAGDRRVARPEDQAGRERVLSAA
jgi:hypothetical protein